MEGFKSVLFVGPNFKNRKGGIVSVLKTYSLSYPDFDLFPSTVSQNKWINFIALPFVLIAFVIYIVLHPEKKIIHIHSSSRGSFVRKYFFYQLSKRIFLKKVIYHVHSGEYHLYYENASKFLKNRIQNVIENADALIVLSEEWEQYFRSRFNQEKIFVVNNVVEYPNKIENKRGDKLRLLFLGKIGEGKGIFNLLKALQILRNKKGREVNLLVGGNGEVDELKRMIPKLGLEDMVSYIGWVSGEKKDEVLNNSDIMILPSRNEGLPISLLEGMSYEMPLIATHVGGIPQILKDDFNGKVIRPDKIDELAEAIEFYLENPEKVEEHGKNSGELVVEFLPQRVRERLETIYNRLL